MMLFLLKMMHSGILIERWRKVVHEGGGKKK